MSVPQAQLDRALVAARAREAQGYFGKVKAGDKRASSLFVRLVAFDLNPSGSTSDYGWLTKQPGEQQVDGYSEDAIVFGADPSNLMNVVDLVIGAGAPNASLPEHSPGVKERRPANVWVKPQALSSADMAYLSSGQPQPQPPVQPYPDEHTWWTPRFDPAAAARYAKAGKPYPDGPGAFRWASRTAYDIRGGLTREQSLWKHLQELEAELKITFVSCGMPVPGTDGMSTTPLACLLERGHDGAHK